MDNIIKQINGEYSFDFKETSKLLIDIEKTLKSEFFDIDEQIEQLIDSIKPWLFFKDSMRSPHVINLVGLTGVGKTDLIRRLVSLLGLKANFHILEASELNSDEPLKPLCRDHFIKNDHPIILIDDFQNYKCKGVLDGEFETYNSSTFNFIDRGAVKFEHGYCSEINEKDRLHFIALTHVLNTLSCIGNDTFKNLSFELGEEWVNKIKEVMTNSNNEQFLQTYTPLSNIAQYSIPKEIFIHIKKCFNVDDNNVFTLKPLIVDNIKQVCKLFNLDRDDYALGGDILDGLAKLSMGELFDFISVLLSDLIDSTKRVELCYNKALIFITANVDEAFYINDNLNADISPDHFRKITKKVNIVDIKTALHKRFRSEQIARLGSVFIIYPSIGSMGFKNIIAKQLSNYSDFIKEKNGIDLVFDKSIHDIIFREGVQPTQGVRNTLSTINDLIKSNVSNSLLYGIENLDSYNRIEYVYKKKHLEVYFYNDGTLLASTKYKLKLRLEKLRDAKNDDRQALSAVHEAGHVVAHILLFKQLPDQVFSITADSKSQGFMLVGCDDKYDIFNKDILLKEVGVLLAGRASEEIVFGGGLVSSGASSDIRKANEILFKAFREWGMRGDILRRTIIPLDNDAAKEIDNFVADQVTRELNTSLNQVRGILLGEEKLLLKLSEHLSKHTTINQKQILKYAREYGSAIDTNELNTKPNLGYKDKLREALNNIE